MSVVLVTLLMFLCFFVSAFLHGLQGVVENASLSSPCGMDVMLDGCVPKVSGLALMCAARKPCAVC